MQPLSNVPSPVSQALIDAALKGAVIALIRRHEDTLQSHEKTEADGHSQSFATKGDWQSEQVIRAALSESAPSIVAALKEQNNTNLQSSYG